MTEVSSSTTDWTGEAMARRIQRRYASERRFRLMGSGAVLLSMGFLVFLLVTMIGNGALGFTRTEVTVPIDFVASDVFLTPEQLKGPGAARTLAAVDLEGAVAAAARVKYGAAADTLLSPNAWTIVRDRLLAEPALLTGRRDYHLPAAPALDAAAKGGTNDPALQTTLDDLRGKGVLTTGFNSSFFTEAAGTDPATVGIWGALAGSLLTMAITLVIAVPIGILAAVYLEEFAPRTRWTDLIEVSINNLAAIPSIIFGLLGLAVFLAFFGLPRAAPIVAGLTLALMTMPVIVIASRNAIKTVPPSIRDAALGVGASPLQVVFHHVVPLALPGILTGTIIGMSRALGETAPLLLIGMRAFIAEAPSGIAGKATVLPVQIFLWSDEVSRGFVEKTSAAIIVLLVVLLSMNAVAIWLRNRFETRW